MIEQHLTDSPDTAGTGTLTIDCAQCTERFTAACSDCVVSFVLGIDERRNTGGGAPEERPDAVVLHLSEARAVRLLAEAGLVAPLRHRRAAAGGSA